MPVRQVAGMARHRVNIRGPTARPAAGGDQLRTETVRMRGGGTGTGGNQEDADI